MRQFLRILLIVVSVISVGALGLYAYILSTDTLKFPFVWQESQQWDIMRIVVSRPTFLSTTNDKPIFDIQAIKDVLLLDGKPWDPTISGEGNMVVSGEYLEIQSYKLNKDQSHFLCILIINAYFLWS